MSKEFRAVIDVKVTTDTPGDSWDAEKLTHGDTNFVFFSTHEHCIEANETCNILLKCERCTCR